MWLFDVFHNPIVIGIIGFVLTYLYIYFNSNKKIDPETNKPQKISFAKPLIVGLLSWFVANNMLAPASKNGSESLVETSEELETESMKDCLSGITTEEAVVIKKGNAGDKMQKVAKVFTDVANF